MRKAIGWEYDLKLKVIDFELIGDDKVSITLESGKVWIVDSRDIEYFNAKKVYEKTIK